MKKLVIIITLIMVSAVASDAADPKLQWTQENEETSGLTHWVIYANTDPGNSDSYAEAGQMSYTGTPSDAYVWPIPESLQKGVVVFTVQAFAGDTESGPAWSVARNFGAPWRPSGLKVVE